MLKFDIFVSKFLEKFKAEELVSQLASCCISSSLDGDRNIDSQIKGRSLCELNNKVNIECSKVCLNHNLIINPRHICHSMGLIMLLTCTHLSII